jgi:hypothetical protein
MMFKIEKGVPLPTGGRGRKKGDLRVAMESMEVGDSLVVHGTLACQLLQNARIIGFKATTRTTPDGGVRVWRTA